MKWQLEQWMILFLIVSFGCVGFVDDYLKVVKKQNEGFSAKHKMFFQVLITAIFIGVNMWTNPDFGKVILPFTNGKTFELGFLLIPFMAIFILGTVNSVNIIDGLDGLASSVTTVVAAFFVLAAMHYGQKDVAFSTAVIGALLGFLIFNCFPARVFMGDTGSLALGGYVAGISLFLHMPLFILITGLIYFIDIASVMIQVAVYKRTKKRVFKMAPIHHHFELLGYHETKVVVYFTLFTLVAGLIGLLAL